MEGRAEGRTERIDFTRPLSTEWRVQKCILLLWIYRNNTVQKFGNKMKSKEDFLKVYLKM